MYFISVLQLGILGVRTSDRCIQVCSLWDLLQQLTGLAQG